MTYKCPFCTETFELMGGSINTRQKDELEWESSLFHHLYWNHEKELSVN